MNVMRAFIGAHSFKIHDVAHHRAAMENPVSIVRVPRHPRDIPRLFAIAALDQADHVARGAAHVRPHYLSQITAPSTVFWCLRCGVAALRPAK